jgi:hypothetical protein
VKDLAELFSCLFYVAASRLNSPRLFTNFIESPCAIAVKPTISMHFDKRRPRRACVAAYASNRAGRSPNLSRHFLL